MRTMYTNRPQSLNNSSNIRYDIDEEDDIYLPDDLLSELKFIFFMLRYIIQHPSMLQPYSNH